MPVKREIIYPVFLECCKYADDVFWETVFEELAYGKAPYGSYISKDFLCCSFRNKEFNYKISRKDPEEMYRELYTLFTERLGLLSYKEKEQKRLDFHQLEKNIKQSRQGWSSIRRKNIKDILFEKYVIEMGKKHGLTLKQKKYLLGIITLSVMFKTIQGRDIEYSDDKITNIKGIEFDNGKILLKNQFYSPSGISSDEEPEEIPGIICTQTMFEYWPRFLKSLGGGEV